MSLSESQTLQIFEQAASTGNYDVVLATNDTSQPASELSSIIQKINDPAGNPIGFTIKRFIQDLIADKLNTSNRLNPLKCNTLAKNIVRIYFTPFVKVARYGIEKLLGEMRSPTNVNLPKETIATQEVSDVVKVDEKSFFEKMEELPLLNAIQQPDADEEEFEVGYEELVYNAYACTPICDDILAAKGLPKGMLLKTEQYISKVLSETPPAMMLEKLRYLDQVFHHHSVVPEQVSDPNLRHDLTYRAFSDTFSLTQASLGNTQALFTPLFTEFMMTMLSPKVMARCKQAYQNKGALGGTDDRLDLQTRAYLNDFDLGRGGIIGKIPGTISGFNQLDANFASIPGFRQL